MSDPTDIAIDLFKWAAGGVAGLLTLAVGALHRRLTGMDTRIDAAIEIATHARNSRTQIELAAERRALEAEKRYATKDDVARLEKKVEDGVRHLSDKIDGLGKR